MQHQKQTNTVSLHDLSTSSVTIEHWIASEEQIETPTQTYTRDLSWDGHNGQGNKYYFSSDNSERIRWYECSNFTANGEIETPEVPGYDTPEDSWETTYSFHTTSRSVKRDLESKNVSLQNSETTEVVCQSWDISETEIITPDSIFYRNHLWDNYNGHGSCWYFSEYQDSIRQLSWFSSYGWGCIRVPEVAGYNSTNDVWETTHTFRTIF